MLEPHEEWSSESGGSRKEHEMTDFALIGAAGFVAPRHLQAIHDVGGTLVGAVDPSDSVGVLDKYFPETRFFTEVERFDRFLEKRRYAGEPVDYVSICSPNYLHDAHVRLALRVRAHAICEKPLVISPWNLDALAALEQEYDKRVFAVLQLRLMPDVIALKHRFENHSGPRVAVDLSYVTKRGPWYHASWKGDDARSGGLAMNIGIHFFDLLTWVFGAAERHEVIKRGPRTVSGTLVMQKADVSFRLSVDESELPDKCAEQGLSAYRCLSVESEEIDLSKGAGALHSAVYRQILAGAGCGIEEARPAIELVHRLRDSQAVR